MGFVLIKMGFVYSSASRYFEAEGVCQAEVLRLVRVV
jgi:hypothetical protein